MTNILYMNWTNECASDVKFVVIKVKHGDTPTAPSSLGGNGGSGTVIAKQSTNLGPGPEGTYQWQSVEDPDQNVTCDYHYPAGGPGQLIQITLNPTNKLEVSFDGAHWASGKLPMSAPSVEDNFYQPCFVRDAKS
jgi:hypothetical protein